MRNLLICAVLFAIPTFANATAKTMRFVEAHSFKQVAGLPPKLQATFSIACNHRLVRVIRTEKTDPETKKMLIYIGGIVEEDASDVNCMGIKEITANAGTTYTGRDFEVNPIAK